MPITYPYKMSDWYGYDKDCSPTPTAFTSSVAIRSQSSVCSATLNQTYYHNGSGSLPAEGDTVYTDSAGTNLLTLTGYYRRSTFGYFQIVSGSPGIAQNFGIC